MGQVFLNVTYPRVDKQIRESSLVKVNSVQSDYRFFNSQKHLFEVLSVQQHFQLVFLSHKNIFKQILNETTLKKNESSCPPFYPPGAVECNSVSSKTKLLLIMAC